MDSSSGEEEESLHNGEQLGLDELFGSEPSTHMGGCSQYVGMEPGKAVSDVYVRDAIDCAQVFDEPRKCSWEEMEELPTVPNEEWVPDDTSVEWARRLFAMMPGPLRRWIVEMEGWQGWETWWRESKVMLPKLQNYALQFSAEERRGAVEHLFGALGLLKGADWDMFSHLLCKFDSAFGHVQFRMGQDVGVIRFVMSMADCFYSLIDDRGFSSALEWNPEPVVRDPEQFVSGGVHSDGARKAWAEMPGVSSYVRHWIEHKVWFKKSEHVIDRDARNAAALREGSKDFDQEKFDFVDAKVAEMLKCSAVEEMPKGVLPDVLTRLSTAPKEGKERFRIIMDMRPENARHFSKKVRMEHLSHFSSVFHRDHLLFSLDLKSAYFSVGVDERLARTMGFEWRGRYYKFKCLPFGFKLAPYVFVKIGRQVVKKWRDIGPGDWQQRFEGWSEASNKQWGVPCMLYIDDSAGGHKTFGMAVWCRNSMMLELEGLGFSLSAKGSLLPFPCLEFLGMVAHLGMPSPSWFLPERKAKVLVKLAEELVEQHKEGKRVLCRMAAKCVGKLVSASRAVPVSKLLFREVNACIYGGKQPQWGGSIALSEAAVADLVWIIDCFVRWNGQCSPIWILSMVETVDCALIQDAGPRAIGFKRLELEGVRAQDAPGNFPTGEGERVAVGEQMLDHISGETHTLRSTSGTIELNDSECDMHHVHKELLGVLLAVASQRWELRNRRVCILVDATTSVAYVTNWGGPSMTCNRVVRKLWGLCARFNIRVVQVSHIAGSKMITSGVDSLSRPYRFARGGEADRDDWRLRSQTFEQLQAVVGVVLTVDRMATRSNRRCKQFCSHSAIDPESFGSSAFAVDWSVDMLGEKAANYCFPPFFAIPRVIQHVRECRAWTVLIVPWWPSQFWWVSLMEVCTCMWALPVGDHFERVKDGEWQTVKGALSFRALVCVIDCR